MSASRDQTARVWNAADGKSVASVTEQAAVLDDNSFAEGHDYDLFAMRFFPDAKRLLTSGFDGTMRIWDSRIDDDQSFGRELATLPETGMYGVVEISRDGEWILTAGPQELGATLERPARVEQSPIQARFDSRWPASLSSHRRGGLARQFAIADRRS